MKTLPVFESVKDAVGYTMSNISLLVKASVFWVAIYTIIVGIFNFMGGEAYMAVIADFSKNQTVNEQNPLEAFNIMFSDLGNLGLGVNLLYIAIMLIGIMAYYAIAISWHRACLLDETPPVARLGKLEFRYFGYTLLIAISLYILFVIGTLALGTIVGFVGFGDPLVAVLVVIAILAIFMALIFGRLNLVFPGIAVRDRRMHMRSSWVATQGNSWRILGGTILCILPALVVALVMNLVSTISLPMIISFPIIFSLQLFSGAFYLSFMSICYQFFVPSPDAGDLA